MSRLTIKSSRLIRSNLHNSSVTSKVLGCRQLFGKLPCQSAAAHSLFFAAP
ncbi:hypothetical protein BBD26_0134 [Lactobacillus delbrueckii subsp. bulgaricus]|nr:hypothetical protein BBD26_0134 [Lactobacillus delbrueckii subsp. bulgaricus]